MRNIEECRHVFGQIRLNNMRLLILSDLHHELWRQHAPIIDPSASQPDMVILAGDIDTGAKAVEWAAALFPAIPVLYIHGNHESYGKNLEDVQDAIAVACMATPNVHFLNCGEFQLQNVRFLVATTWTDFRLFGDDDRQAVMRAAEEVMVDYQRIRLAKNGYRKLRAGDTAKFHAMHKSWLQKKLVEPFCGKTVVVTHMAPSLLSVAEKQNLIQSLGPTPLAWMTSLVRRIYGYMATCMTHSTITLVNAGWFVILAAT